MDGRSVLVTGGAAGAGLAIARKFQAQGARVSVCDVDSHAIKAAHATGLLAYNADVSSEADVDNLFGLIEKRHGPISILINNVGIGGPTAGVEDVSVDDWNRTMAVNLSGHFLCIRRAVPAMKMASDGVIVSISSASAKVGLPMRSPYVVSKAAVLSLTTTLARELGPHGIRVNAILPGAIRGERIERIIREKADALGISEAEYQHSMFRYMSLGTMVEPEDIADMTVFLASNAGRRITGQLIGVDGGMNYEE